VTLPFPISAHPDRWIQPGAAAAGDAPALLSLSMVEIEVRPIPLAETRSLRKQVLRPHQSLAELATHEPAGSVAFGAFDRDELVAVGLVGAEGEPGEWRVRGMATLPHARGRGAGSRILQALVQHASAHGATRVWCNARVRALTLYERAGFAVASELFEPADIGPHYRMELSLGAHG
jgi:GNAT superfamily N-acetyltransferase